MRSCPDCGFEMTDGSKYLNCRLSFEETSGATAFFPHVDEKPPSSHSTESADGSRFSAGTMLAGRYPIVNLFGGGEKRRPIITAALVALYWLLLLIAYFRIGLLAVATGNLVLYLLNQMPMGTDLTDWYSVYDHRRCRIHRRCRVGISHIPRRAKAI
ncbi:MAG: hypothetical protein ABIR33_11610 [Pyrinomonadaceae bacterium]